MSKLNIEAVPSVEERNLPIFDEIEDIAEKIRVRAFNLFANRGFQPGNDLEDWLHAEREICWPTAELIEKDDEFEVKVALAGFEAKDISVTATPREIIIKAKRTAERKKTHKEEGGKVRWSEFRSNDVYRHITLPADVDVKKISAEFENGMLEIEAPIAKGKSSAGTESGKTRNVKISS